MRCCFLLVHRIMTVGWILAAAYAVAAVSLALTIIFIPFVPNALKIAW